VSPIIQKICVDTSADLHSIAIFLGSCNYALVERKPQQQTLSIRISDTLRDFLERAKHVISNGRNDFVSTSDVAKILLESAKDEGLDFRLEVAQLQQAPTESLVALRKKWQQGQQAWSRAEWIFLAQYIQIACEGISENPLMPGRGVFATMLEALLAVRSLRTDRGAGLDRYYAGNLDVPEDASFNERQFDPEFVPKIVGSLIRGLRESPSSPRKPVGVGRNFYVALRDEELSNVMALNRALEPFLPTLFRLAARGHWIREHRPVRARRQEEFVNWPSVPTNTEGDFYLSGTVGSEGEVHLALTMDSRGAVYPLGPYPQIREFAAMLEQMEPGKRWDGPYFDAWSDTYKGQGLCFVFRRHKDLVTFSLPEEEWKRLKRLFLAALAEPALQALFDELALVYGEV
jgi:hypothetical protein